MSTESAFNELMGSLLHTYGGEPSTAENEDEPECLLELDNGYTFRLGFEGDELYIKEVGLPTKRVRGIVIAHIIKFILKDSLSFVVKDVSSDDETFWKKLGFERIGLETDFILTY